MIRLVSKRGALGIKSSTRARSKSVAATFVHDNFCNSGHSKKWSINARSFSSVGSSIECSEDVLVLSKEVPLEASITGIEDSGSIIDAGNPGSKKKSSNEGMVNNNVESQSINTNTFALNGHFQRAIVSKDVQRCLEVHFLALDGGNLLSSNSYREVLSLLPSHNKVMAYYSVLRRYLECCEAESCGVNNNNSSRLTCLISKGCDTVLSAKPGSVTPSKLRGMVHFLLDLSHKHIDQLIFEKDILPPLIQAISRHGLDVSSLLHRIEAKTGQTLDYAMLLQTIPAEDLSALYILLRRYIYNCKQNSTPPQMTPFLYLCDAVGAAPPTVQPLVMETVVRFLTTELNSLDPHTYQHPCLPRLLLSIQKRPKSDTVRPVAIALLEYMRKKKFPVNAEAYAQILTRSDDRHDRHLPYYKILRGLVAQGHAPESPVAMSALRNESPFWNCGASAAMLADLHVLRSAMEGIHPGSQKYRVDRGTLESIASSAAARGEETVLLKVWDMVETYGYQNGEDMYESAIMTFFNAKRDHRAFTVLKDMEENGFLPSRALIRSVSRVIGFSANRIDHAYYVLTEHKPGTSITTSSLNCVLSACAENGSADLAFATFDEFNKYEVTPNSDSFSFLMEALAEECRMMTPPSTTSKLPSHPNGLDDEDETHTALDIYQEKANRVRAVAQDVSDMISAKGSDLEWNCHSLHHLVRIHTHLKEFRKAKDCVTAAIENDQRVMFDTVSILAMGCAKNGSAALGRDVMRLCRSKGLLFDDWNMRYLERQVKIYEDEYGIREKEAILMLQGG